MSKNSITAWILQLRDGDRSAAQNLWNAYYRRLMGIARQKLDGRYHLVGDEEDVALSAFKSFCRGLEQGHYPQLADRDGLWSLLVTITLHKALHLIRDEDREKRGGGWKRLTDDGQPFSPGVLEQLTSAEFSPELTAQVAEEADRLLASLGNAELIELAVLKMEGHSNSEIAERWGKAERTVERKLNLIRKMWMHENPLS